VFVFVSDDFEFVSVVEDGDVYEADMVAVVDVVDVMDAGAEAIEGDVLMTFASASLA
jgi:hypothetical protein